MNGHVNVVSLNRTVSEIKANASSTGGTIGVGVAVAINVLRIDNLASIGDARIYATDLNVKAIVAHPKLAEEEEKKKDTRDMTLIEKLNEVLTEKITDLLDGMGLAKYSEKLGGDIGNYISNIVNELATTLLAGTGFEGLMNVQPDKFTTQWAQNIVELKAMVEDIPNQLLKKVEGIADALLGTSVISQLTPGQKVDVRKFFADMAMEALANPAQDIGRTILANGITQLINLLLQTIQDGMTGKDFDSAGFQTSIKEVFTSAVDNLKTELINKLWANADAALGKIVPGLDHTNIKDKEQVKLIVGNYFKQTLTEMGDQILDKLTVGIVDLPTFITL